MSNLARMSAGVSALHRTICKSKQQSSMPMVRACGERTTNMPVSVDSQSLARAIRARRTLCSASSGVPSGKKSMSQVAFFASAVGGLSQRPASQAPMRPRKPPASTSPASSKMRASRGRSSSTASRKASASRKSGLGVSAARLASGGWFPSGFT
eukprot:scaffold58790_cov65-Phaeocystis_antarctica.AAC.13